MSAWLDIRSNWRDATFKIYGAQGGPKKVRSHVFISFPSGHSKLSSTTLEVIICQLRSNCLPRNIWSSLQQPVNNSEWPQSRAALGSDHIPPHQIVLDGLSETKKRQWWSCEYTNTSSMSKTLCCVYGPKCHLSGLQLTFIGGHSLPKRARRASRGRASRGRMPAKLMGLLPDEYGKLDGRNGSGWLWEGAVQSLLEATLPLFPVLSNALRHNKL